MIDPVSPSTLDGSDALFVVASLEYFPVPVTFAVTFTVTVFPACVFSVPI